MNDAYLGDACATQMGEAGEINPGQLVRDAYGTDAWLVGFTMHHDIGLDRFFPRLDDAAARATLAPPRLERAIVVICRPDTERMSHYLTAL